MQANYTYFRDALSYRRTNDSYTERFINLQWYKSEKKSASEISVNFENISLKFSLNLCMFFKSSVTFHVFPWIRFVPCNVLSAVQVCISTEFQQPDNELI
jgi:hypothetical protein